MLQLKNRLFHSRIDISRLVIEPTKRVYQRKKNFKDKNKLIYCCFCCVVAKAKDKNLFKSNAKSANE